MLLSREIMPRYARMSPESANIFDNLHMLHGIAYSILAYKGGRSRRSGPRCTGSSRPWATSRRRGLRRKFREPHPDFDPRTYPAWVRSPQGAMGMIMMDMLMEMLPMMYPGGLSKAAAGRRHAAGDDERRLGIEPGEVVPGSLRDALMQVAPGMMTMPGSTEPGEAPAMMVEHMVQAWKAKAARMPDVAPIDMSVEPSLGPGASPPLRRRPMSTTTRAALAAFLASRRPGLRADHSNLEEGCPSPSRTPTRSRRTASKLSPTSIHSIRNDPRGASSLMAVPRLEWGAFKNFQLSVEAPYRLGNASDTDQASSGRRASTTSTRRGWSCPPWRSRSG